MKIGIVVGSIREGRNGLAVGEWVAEQASQRDGFEYEIVDLKSFDVPLLTSATVPGAANKKYDSEAVTKWSQAIDALDGFIFVTPEYNHSIPGAFKNAFDSLGSEWQGKPVAFVSYGADSGVRAVEHWRAAIANFSMHDVRAQVPFSLFTDFSAQGFQPADRHLDAIKAVFDQLEAATTTARG